MNALNLQNKALPNMNPLNTFLEYKDFRHSTHNQNIILQCLDPSCEVCDAQSTMICLQCLPGFFLLEGKCYNACPQTFMADIYKRECVPLALRQRSNFII